MNLTLEWSIKVVHKYFRPVIVSPGVCAVCGFHFGWSLGLDDARVAERSEGRFPLFTSCLLEVEQGGHQAHQEEASDPPLPHPVPPAAPPCCRTLRRHRQGKVKPGEIDG